jgi:hypothetical protein
MERSACCALPRQQVESLMSGMSAYTDRTHTGATATSASGSSMASTVGGRAKQKRQQLKKVGGSG